MRPVNDAFAQEHAVFRCDLTAEKPDFAGAIFRKGACDGVVGIEHRDAGTALRKENLLLGGLIVLIARMNVQMVRRNVGNDRNIRPAVHAVELEGAELEHRPVCARHFRRFVKQRRADVAAEKYAVSLRLQELGNNGGSRRLSVRAGHGDDAARADGKERLHFRRKKRSARFGRGELRRKGVKPRRAENHVLGDTGKVPIAQHKTTARRFQRCGLVLAESLARAFIAHRDGIPRIEQKPQQRPIAHAETDDRNAFSAQRLYIRVECHNCLLNIFFNLYIIFAFQQKFNTYRR